MSDYMEHEGGLVRRTADEILRVEPWGPHALRVSATAGTAVDRNLPGALDSTAPTAPDAGVSVLPDGTARLVNGRITAHADTYGRLRFTHTATGRELLAEKRAYTWYQGPRVYADGRVEQHFEAYDGERVHGLGQHLHGRLDQKGHVIDLVQGNTVATIPFLNSSRGYGLLWNNPALGRVELGADITRWTAETPGADRIDYWITAGDPAEIMESYADATGHPPLLPEWASGFWQSKLRYRTQDELLAVAREYKERGLPLSVIVSDFFHWPKMGDWRFEESEWPDPAAMAKELEAQGVKLAVSVWPTLEPDSENYAPLQAVDGLVRDGARDGEPLTFDFPARGHGADLQPMAYYDPTNPMARRLMWQRLNDNYRSQGVTAFWLDSAEPDMPPALAARALYSTGPGTQVTNLYGLYHAQAVADGLRAAGDDRPLTLIRSAWAGSQRHGTALWSGDISSTFDSLARQIRAGLNVAMSGIPWWNTDIGGFNGGDPADPAYQELLVRWFQYGTFSPIMRLHGDRAPNHPTFSADMTGGPNEVWSYGEEAYPILADHLRLRERLRPYLAELSEQAHRTGAPPMRPLFFGFPEDERAWDVDDQFLLGPDVLVAPVYEAGARARSVYLPGDCRWLDPATGTFHEGGTSVEAMAPLSRIPVFVREGATVSAAFAAQGGDGRNSL
ncbi:glycoside hydrolase family 31 protein [Streptomyces sp. GQFP]|uniref:glycoside hydrolase family 31 protein n=1 Tax=Streptomyces sp. GQFP TaxID=2907545 RepID=UPI001F20921D|nr:TIM-barrel domain-containing protein [Streptomyces sp. GQFP]UIX29206.1 family 31 glucosidase [Streptomyces sp. GQFP]